MKKVAGTIYFFNFGSQESLSEADHCPLFHRVARSIAETLANPITRPVDPLKDSAQRVWLAAKKKRCVAFLLSDLH